jgi:hypothetical protein
MGDCANYHRLQRGRLPPRRVGNVHATYYNRAAKTKDRRQYKSTLSPAVNRQRGERCDGSRLSPVSGKLETDIAQSHRSFSGSQEAAGWPARPWINRRSRVGYRPRLTTRWIVDKMGTGRPKKNSRPPKKRQTRLLRHSPMGISGPRVGCPPPQSVVRNAPRPSQPGHRKSFHRPGQHSHCSGPH